MRMDPAYRPFFAHVYAVCWPWLWWNLVWFTAWRKRTGRRAFISVDKYGNIYIRYVGDAKEANPLPAWRPRWDDPSLESDLPQGVELDLNPASGMARIYPFLFRAIYGPFMGHAQPTSAPVRAPP